MSLYDMPVSSLKGFGKTRAELFSKLNINSVGELLRFYPRSYSQWGDVTPIAELSNGEKALIKATVVTAVSTARIKGGRLLSKVQVADDSGVIELVFFNNKYISSLLKFDEEYCFYGKVSRDIYGFSMTAPEFKKLSDMTDITPVYNLTHGLTNRMVITAVKQALSLLPDVMTDPLPYDILKQYDLCTLRFALNNIHFPDSEQSLEKARKRLVFEEFLVLSLGLKLLKNRKLTQTSCKMPVDYTKDFITTLPYELTGAQKHAVTDCINDMKNKKSPMNRLVQGDVGSGKTAVAAAVCYNCVKNGYQAAFMAPTEILATQHFENLQKMFSDFDINIGLLVGSMTKSKKDKVREKLVNGEIDIIIGTHALITDATKFKNLGSAITDEQHRFGVEQRSKLAQKGEKPHVLVLSATPIPRTLALIIYGDLDITCIDELPPGRKPVQTMMIDTKKRDKALAFIREEIDNGRQCYVVCPLVEDGELPLESAENYAAELMLNAFAHYPVGILHGKMKAKDKDAVMNSFSSGEISILVSTTVIEVGVDVKNASVMMIENADRFGLSQLHQLRGRVGRGEHKSYCILVSDNKNEDTLKRLSTMCRTNNGFEIADEDLKLRGPGDFFGNRQHGLPQLNIADFSDMDSLRASQQAANFILNVSPDLSNDNFKGLRGMVKLLWKSIDNGALN
ncbi:MAG: ATP-dependent DNA helicase RecG [Ruminococcus sp.]|nr:ATP-dependent DNA helicase RecG [Ruminococcus sp.]